MKKNLFVYFVACMIVSILSFSQTPLKAQESEYNDTPWFSGMPNYLIYTAEDIEFDSYNFFNGKNCTKVEGRKFWRQYTLKEDAQKSSVIQITRNYANAIRSKGGTIIFEGTPQDADCANFNGLTMLVGRIVNGNEELWVEVASLGGEEYYLTVLLKELMRQDVTASDMFETIKRDGRVALYINFDTGKSNIRDESEPIIDQIAQMLKSNPDLKLSVEGHTDNVGNPASNKILSEERARSVVSALVSKGISPDRLTASGYGQEKPVADNNTEEGRARNRRVELVKK